MTRVIGGSHDGETLDEEISVRLVPMSHVVGGDLLGVDWYFYDRDADELRVYRYDDWTWLPR